jgi:hypothetical protein
MQMHWEVTAQMVVGFSILCQSMQLPTESPASDPCVVCSQKSEIRSTVDSDVVAVDDM